LSVFCRLFADELSLPADGLFLGGPVSVTACDYDGDARRGLTTGCSKEDGVIHHVMLADVACTGTGSAYGPWDDFGKPKRL